MHYFPCRTVRRDIQDSDEESVRVKEQSILELGSLLAKTGQAAGETQNTKHIIWSICLAVELEELGGDSSSNCTMIHCMCHCLTVL